MNEYQYLRKGQLFVANEEEVLDLSELRFRFNIKAADAESPTNASIRITNAADSTVERIRRQFNRVIVQAGYGDNVGTIFEGTIKQFGLGRESSTDTYFDIFAADGDMAYNFAMCNRTLAPGSTMGDRVAAAVEPMRAYGVNGQQVLMPQTGGVLPRGKVLFGMPRATLRVISRTVGATWNIQNGQVRIVPKEGYAPNEVVVLNGQTGLIGRPEQTVDGVRARCLINPRISVGGRVQIDNAAINQIIQRNPLAPVPYNQWAGLQLLANVTADGIYRVFVAEYDGDSRGPQWYCDLTLLAIDASSDEVLAS